MKLELFCSCYVYTVVFVTEQVALSVQREVVISGNICSQPYVSNNFGLRVIFQM